MSICGIYVIENLVNRKVYIGQSIDIKRRFCEHKLKLNKDKHLNPHLQNAWNKYGENNFAFKILESCSKNDLDSREISYIEQYKKFGIYNQKDGGAGGRVFDELSIAKMRNSAKGNTKGKANKGRIVPPEVGRKISKSKKGIPAWNKGKKAKEGQVPWNKGMKYSPMSEELRNKIGNSNKGKIRSEESKQIYREAWIARKLKAKNKKELGEQLCIEFVL